MQHKQARNATLMKAWKVFEQKWFSPKNNYVQRINPETVSHRPATNLQGRTSSAVAAVAAMTLWS